MNFLSAASQSMKNPANVLLFPPCSLSMVAFSGTEERRTEEGSWRTHLIRQSDRQKRKRYVQKQQQQGYLKQQQQKQQ